MFWQYSASFMCLRRCWANAFYNLLIYVKYESRMPKRKLKKSLGFWDVPMFGVGGIVGAGIYAIIGQAAGLSGNMLWLSFALAACVDLLPGLSYAEFVSRFPDAGGSYEYIKRGIGLRTALFMSIFMTFTGIVAAAAIAISFSEYLGRLVQFPKWLALLNQERQKKFT